MKLVSAPLHDDMVGVPEGGRAYWLKTSDGIRIRVGVWRPEGRTRGTVLMLPGRTEYVEKYGDTAGELGRRGYATLVIDWRGQGLADRLLDDTRLGHVNIFTDYQKDLAAAMKLARAIELPTPFHLIGHSMGGGIGLRAVMEGLPVQSCAFTGPMWGIYMSPMVKPFGWALSHVAPMVGMGTRLPPSTRHEGYVTANAFDGNALTTEPSMYRMMQDQLAAHPELGIGGPTLVWLRESLMECRTLAQRPSPDLPCITFLGSGEQIIDCEDVRQRMDRWPNGRLEIVQGARHEVLMETPEIRADVFDQLDELFSRPPSGTQDSAVSA
ncbi:alpha/beta hydrolase [Sedimentitalea sp. XS_ASV28]|uniref:alpha/beta hydrolase n=1 Tax=Sedimentitalea sp. XS_ASV28 TaxID=3241296 RepID=UPI0035161E20